MRVGFEPTSQDLHSLRMAALLTHLNISGRRPEEKDDEQVIR